MLGLDPAAVTGRPLAELALPFPCDWESIRKRARGRQPYRAETELVRSNIRRVLGYSLRVLEGAEGDEGTLILFQDLTDVKKLEGRLRFNEQLAAVGELAAGIAHEIRNPLASISGSVQVLSNELTVGSTERRLMEIIVSESNRLSGILEEFLRFVRPQERARRGLRRGGDRRRRSWRSSGSPTKSPTPTRSKWTFPPRRRPSPETATRSARSSTTSPRTRFARWTRAAVSTVHGREERGGYTIQFADTGRGMSPDELARLFTPFSTAFDGGTGLGMAIVRQDRRRPRRHDRTRISTGRRDDRDDSPAA